MTETKVTTPDVTDVKPLRTKHVAAKFGMKPVQLRRILRTMPEYADGVHTNYAWAEKDPALARIEAAIKKAAALKIERAKAAKAALEARVAAAAKQAELDKKIA
jgi:hypothetical protein